MSAHPHHCVILRTVKFKYNIIVFIFWPIWNRANFLFRRYELLDSSFASSAGKLPDIVIRSTGYQSKSLSLNVRMESISSLLFRWYAASVMESARCNLYHRLTLQATMAQYHGRYNKSLIWHLPARSICRTELTHDWYWRKGDAGRYEMFARIFHRKSNENADRQGCWEG